MILVVIHDGRSARWRKTPLCRRQQRSQKAGEDDTYQVAVTYERSDLLTILSAYTNASFIIYTEFSLCSVLFFLLAVLKWVLFLLFLWYFVRPVYWVTWISYHVQFCLAFQIITEHGIICGSLGTRPGCWCYAKGNGIMTTVVQGRMHSCYYPPQRQSVGGRGTHRVHSYLTGKRKIWYSNKSPTYTVILFTAGDWNSVCFLEPQLCSL